MKFASFTVIILLNVPAVDVPKEDKGASAPAKQKVTVDLPVLSLSGIVKEFAASHSFGSLWRVISMYDVYSSFEKIKKLDNVKEVAIDIGPLYIGPSAASEIASMVKALRGRGLKVHAFLQIAQQYSYILAAGCDTVTMAPDSWAYFFGVPLWTFLAKGYLEKRGIDILVYKAGKYKGGEQYTNKYDLSDAFKEELGQVGNDLYNSMLKRIAEARSVDPKSVEVAFDKVVLSSDDMLKLKLVDGVSSRDEWLKSISERLKTGDEVSVNIANYPQKGGDLDVAKILSVFSTSHLQAEFLKIDRANDRIAVIFADGVIIDGESDSPAPGIVFSGDYSAIIKKVLDDDRVKGVVLRVNSPGGSASASEQILQALKKLNEKKPVVVSMGQLAASGGYYISCASRRIYADADTITGSIGVIGMFPVRQYMYNYMGLKKMFMGMGRGSKFFDDNEPPDGVLEGLITTNITRVYNMFKDRVSAARNMGFEEVEKIAQGRIYSGATAKNLKLVDELGSLGDAIAHAAELAGIKDGNYGIISYPKRPVFGLERIGGMGMEGRIGGSMSHMNPPVPRLSFSGALDALERLMLDDTYSGSPFKALAVMPFLISF